MGYSKSGSFLLHVLSAGAVLSKMASLLIYMATQLGQFEHLGPGETTQLGSQVQDLSPCCWLGSSTILHIAYPSSHLPPPSSPPTPCGIQSSREYPDYLISSWALRKRKQKLPVFLLAHHFCLKILSLKNLQISIKLFLFVLVNLGLKIVLTVSINILCSLHNQNSTVKCPQRL